MQQPGLTIRYSAEPEPVLHVAGELDIATAPALRQALLKLAQGDELTDLVVEAPGVAFVDSSGLAVLLMAARRWAAQDKKVVLRRPSQPLRRVIDLAGAGRAFSFED